MRNLCALNSRFALPGAQRMCYGHGFVKYIISFFNARRE